ncbi:MAG: CheR family methyltransferase [Myxococcaceae bacterium]
MQPRASALVELIEQIRHRFGLDFSGTRLDNLVECLSQADGDLDAAAQRALSGSRERLAELVGRATNNETCFFRHPDHFDALTARLIASWTRLHPAVFRAWCAGCASGEEALSLAATLRQVSLLVPGVQLSILGTDLSEEALRRAAEARYTEWSFRGVSPEQRTRHFVRQDAFYRPVEALRRLVSYRRHNLLDGAPEPEAFDLVVCRNVLIYFDEPRLRQAVNLLSLAVAPGGLLLLGPTESGAVRLPDFEPIHARGCVLYEKRQGLLAPREPAPFSPAPAVRAAPAPPAPGPAPHPEDRLSRARALADHGRLDEAWALAGEALTHSGDSAELRLLFATISLERGHRDDAVQELERAIRAAPDLAMAHYLFGSVLEAEGAREPAEASYQRALAALGDTPIDAPVRGAGGLTVGELVEAIGAALRGGFDTGR